MTSSHPPIPGRARFGLVLLVALVAGACSASGSGRADTVAAVVDGVLVPGFVDAAAAATALDEAAGDLCRSPGTETLDAARDSWREAVTAWRRTEVAWEGPVKMDRLESLVHYPSIAPDSIEEWLAGHTAGDPVDAGSLASVIRGLGTAEYLLFGSDDPAQVADPARCDLLLAVTAGAADGTARAEEAWTTGWDGGPPYADILAGRGEGAMEANAAVAELVRSSHAILSAVTIQGLGLALGITRQDPLPEALDEGSAGVGGDILAARIGGIGAVYDPTGDLPGIGDLVAEQSEEVDANVRAELDAAMGGIVGLGNPLVEAVAASPEEATAVYDALVELRRSFEADVASLLDVTIGFGDTDGDSG